MIMTKYTPECTKLQHSVTVWDLVRLLINFSNFHDICTFSKKMLFSHFLVSSLKMPNFTHYNVEKSNLTHRSLSCQVGNTEHRCTQLSINIPYGII